MTDGNGERKHRSKWSDILLLCFCCCIFCSDVCDSAPEFFFAPVKTGLLVSYSFRPDALPSDRRMNSIAYKSEKLEAMGRDDLHQSYIFSRNKSIRIETTTITLFFFQLDASIQGVKFLLQPGNMGVLHSKPHCIPLWSNLATRSCTSTSCAWTHSSFSLHFLFLRLNVGSRPASALNSRFACLSP